MVYISKKQIMTRFKRYKELNETRLSHALSLMSSDASYCLSIVPVLLHYNHINLPGFRGYDVPQGIDMFKPDALQERYLKSMVVPGAPQLKEPKEHAILGLYAMGSTSSLGQSDSSDVDIWVCVKANLSAEHTRALQDKCRFITNYIKSQGVELNLFVTPEDRFTNFQPDCLDEENCGSAQNLFLLDEFYRSSIRLCGRYIIWYLISTKEEQQSYQDYINFLTKGISGMEQFVVPDKELIASNALNSSEATAALALAISYKLSLGSAQLRSVCPLMANHFVLVHPQSRLSISPWHTDPWPSLNEEPLHGPKMLRMIDVYGALLNFSGAMELAYPVATQLFFAYPVVINSLVGNSISKLVVNEDKPSDAISCSYPTIEELERLNTVAFAEAEIAFKTDNDDLIDQEYFKQHGEANYCGFCSLADWGGQSRSDNFSSGYISNYAIGDRSNVSYSLVSYEEDALEEHESISDNTISDYVGLNPQDQALVDSDDNQLTLAANDNSNIFTLEAEPHQQDHYVLLLKDRDGRLSQDKNWLALEPNANNEFDSLKEDREPFAFDDNYALPEQDSSSAKERLRSKLRYKRAHSNAKQDANIWYFTPEDKEQAWISSVSSHKHEDFKTREQESLFSMRSEEETFDAHLDYYDTDYDLLSLGGNDKSIGGVELSAQEIEYELDSDYWEISKEEKLPQRTKKRSRVAKKASVRMVRVARSLAKSTSFNLSLQRLFPSNTNEEPNLKTGAHEKVIGSASAARAQPHSSQSISSPYAQDLITGSLAGEETGAVSLSLDDATLSDSVVNLKPPRQVKVAGFERLAAAMGVTPMPFFAPSMPLDPNAFEENSSSSMEDLDHYVDGKKQLDNPSETYPQWAYGHLLSEQECIQAAMQDEFIEGEAPLDSSEWFDFGSVVKNSPTEYFGSGLWLLYKAIESPFKVVLKILLMEAYSNDYPNSRLLSSELKDYMLSHDGYSLDLDSYYLMYLKVSNYLQSIKHDSRLMLMRKCFYLKIFMGLNNKSSAHRADYKLKRGLLDKFSVRWGWSKDFVSELEQVSNWKMELVRKFNKEVYNTLLESYQSLLRFSVRHGIEYAITSDDAGILSRKLYAAFDRFPGKVIVMHSSFSHNLEERDLTFICPSPSSLCRKGWHMYSAAGDDVALLNLKVSYIGARLSEVVTWACFNGLLSARTATYVKGAPTVVTPFKIKKLSSDIMRVLEPKRGRVSERTLQRSVKMKACLVVLNLEKDDTELLQNKFIDIDYSSTLCCGRSRSCLIGSIDLIYLNSWGELRSIALPNGEEGVVELLATLLRIMSSTMDNVDSVQSMLDLIEVCSYAASYQDLIKYDLESTIRQVFNCMTTTGSSEYVFEVGRNTYIARAQKDRGVMINKKSVFGSSEFDISVLSRYGMRPEYALQVPPLVDRYATAGIVQYFFCPLNLDKGHWDIYIVNERNEVNIYHNYFGSRASLVNAINRFYTNQSQNRSKNSVRFNLPQYFVLNRTLDAIHPFTIRTQNDEVTTEGP